MSIKPIGFSPALAAFLSILLGGALGVIIVSVWGVVGPALMAVIWGTMLAWFVVCAIWEKQVISAIGFCLYHLWIFFSILLCGWRLDPGDWAKDQKVLQYSPLLLLVVSAAVAGPLMWVIGWYLGLTTFVFWAAMVIAIIALYLVLMVVISTESKPLVEPEGSSAPQGYFPTGRSIIDALGRIKEAACPRFHP